jgi:hypothetical protein
MKNEEVKGNLQLTSMNKGQTKAKNVHQGVNVGASRGKPFSEGKNMIFGQIY